MSNAIVPGFTFTFASENADPDFIHGGSTFYSAFKDSTMGDKLTVYKNSSGTWEAFGEGISDGAINDVSLAYDNGTLYAAYQDEFVTENGGLTVLQNSGSGWSTVGAPRGFTTIDNPKIIAKDGILYVAYQLTPMFNGEGVIKVAKWNGSAWSDLGQASPGITQSSFGFQCDGDIFYLAFRDFDFGSDLTVLASIDAQNWGIMGERGITGDTIGAVDLLAQDGRVFVSGIFSNLSDEIFVLEFL